MTSKVRKRTYYFCHYVVLHWILSKLKNLYPLYECVHTRTLLLLTFGQFSFGVAHYVYTSEKHWQLQLDNSLHSFSKIKWTIPSLYLPSPWTQNTGLGDQKVCVWTHSNDRSPYVLIFKSHTILKIVHTFLQYLSSQTAWIFRYAWWENKILLMSRCINRIAIKTYRFSHECTYSTSLNFSRIFV